MKAAFLVLLLPFVVLGQTDSNLDVITLNHRPCPLQGDAKSPEVKALNRLKGRYHSPVTSDIDPTVTLTAMVAPGDDENRFNTRSAATITGLVLKVMVGGKETCNCHATAADERDTHIVLAPSEGAEEIETVIVEVTPRTRLLHERSGPDAWTTDALKRKYEGKWVEVTGWLLFDMEHIGQAENTNPGGAKNWRATCWEVHPVTSIKPMDTPPDSFRLASTALRAMQKSQAAHVDLIPGRREFLEERNEKYRRRFAEDEHDEPEREGAAR